jgi:hypothetical protein
MESSRGADVDRGVVPGSAPSTENRAKASVRTLPCGTMTTDAKTLANRSGKPRELKPEPDEEAPSSHPRRKIHSEWRRTLSSCNGPEERNERGDRPVRLGRQG